MRGRRRLVEQEGAAGSLKRVGRLPNSPQVLGSSNEQRATGWRDGSQKEASVSKTILLVLARRLET
jgi:hypothetical protein